ncbi:MAG: ATP-binding protein [Candidatus Woesearchaeota archaeon]|nr:MAG: ATP-binding protein [Candidatus Woesearchaeota archaeon]
MTQDIVVGRSKADEKKFGNRGLILLGKQYIKMGRTLSLSNNIYMDVATAHVVFVVGKRGSGKSYSLGVIAEGISDLAEGIKDNVAVLILDTMGIYWTMKTENRKDAALLKEWGLEEKGLDVKIYTPAGVYEKYKEEGIPTDFPFAIKPGELDVIDWCNAFGIDQFSGVGIVIQRAIAKLIGEDYSIDGLIDVIGRDVDADIKTKSEATSLLLSANEWGLFSEEGTEIKDIIKGGQVSVLDVSSYATTPGGWGIKGLAIGLIAKKLFIDRMIIRKKEELEAVEQGYSYLGEVGEEDTGNKMPMVWLVIDEAHEFLPHKGKNAATDALVTILREGRQPGISLVLASQQPGKIHGDVLTQADLVIAHKVTAKQDVEALNEMMQSYMTKGLTDVINELPSEAGAAVVLDDNSERIYPIKVRPRATWHGGEAPSAILSTRRKLQLEL